MSLEIFACRAKQLRDEHNLSTRMLAEELNVSNALISFYENCKREPTLSVMKSYAQYFKVSLDYLVGLSDNKEEYYAKNKKP